MVEFLWHGGNRDISDSIKISRNQVYGGIFMAWRKSHFRQYKNLGEFLWGWKGLTSEGYG